MDLLNIIQQLVLIVVEFISLLLFTGYIYSERVLRLIIPRPLKSLDGEIILITGTGNGIGRQLALQLAKTAPKAKFICWDVEVNSNENTVEQMKKMKVEAYAYTVDLSDRESVVEMCSKVREEIGQVSVIINNAGICTTGPFLLQKPETIVKTFEINLFAHFWIIAEFLPEMIRRNHGHIISIASLSSFLPTRDIACYAASKHGVHGFIDSLKKELQVHPAKPTNIKFTTVYPVIVNTRISEPVKVRPRFPLLFPKNVSPEYIAKKTIEGFRRNYEYLCLPPYSYWLALIAILVPIEVVHKVENGLCRVDLQHSNLNKEDVKNYQNTGKRYSDTDHSKTL